MRSTPAITRRNTLLGATALLAGCVSPRPAPDTSRIAVAQMTSTNNDRDSNLAAAAALCETAAAQRPQLVVFPEFMSIGYDLSPACWDAGETMDGPTVAWLKEQSARHGMYIGTSFLEADGEDFFNTFVLTAPSGAIAGTVRKETPAGAEGFFFRGEAGPHFIDTDLGRIGVVICQENYRCFAAHRMAEARPDLILAPHSFPDMSASGGLPAPPGTHIADWYATRLGVPVAMVNKTGAWTSPVIGSTQPISGRFPGQSAIVSGAGETQVLMDDQPGVATADVRLGARLAPAPEALCTGPIIPELSISPPETREQSLREGAALEQQAAAFYASSPQRREKALQISGG